MMQPEHQSSPSCVTVSGSRYYTAADVAKIVGVSRQTLWRWRQAGKVPAGQRYRDRQILFTPSELETIRDFAQRLEPALPGTVTEETGARQ